MELLKVLVQAVVLDRVDGFPVDYKTQVVEVPASEWLDYPPKLLDSIKNITAPQTIQSEPSEAAKRQAYLAGENTKELDAVAVPADEGTTRD